MGETLSTLFQIIQASPIDANVFMKNSGVNTLNYRFQEWDGNTWVDLGASGSDFYNTLQPNQVICLELESGNTKIQLVGNASGGAYLEFAVTRYFNRESGGALPLLNL